MSETGNGTNSNTNGSQVANVGFWPRGTLPAVIDALEQTFVQLEALEEGTQLAGAVDFAEKGAVDKLPDATMAEICRRLVVTVEKQEPGNIIYSPEPPEDKTKAWMPTDPVTGLPLDGKLKIWDEDSTAWVYSDVQGGYTPPLKRELKQRVAAGASTVNFPFADIKTDNYYVVVTFTTQNDDGTWNAPPGSYPAGFGYLVGNKTNTQVSIAFYGVPTGGMMVEGYVEQKTAN